MSASLAARRACSMVSAATAKIAWPTNITLSTASTGSSWAWTALMSLMPGMLSAVSTSTTPGAARTFETSTFSSRACARALWPM